MGDEEDGVTGDASCVADVNDSEGRERGAKEDQVVTYEQERLARIQRNKEALARVGLGTLGEHNVDASGGGGGGGGGEGEGGGDEGGGGSFGGRKGEGGLGRCSGAEEAREGDEVLKVGDRAGGGGEEDEESLFSDMVLGLPPPAL